MNVKMTLPAILSFLLLVLSCSPQNTSAQTTNREAPVEVKAVRPHRGEIYRYINLPGEVHPLYHVTLFAKVDGYLTTLTVDKGDSVKKGDLIADIDVPQLKANRVKYKAEVELAEAEFEQANESPANNPNGGSAAETKAGKNRILLAKGHLTTAKANLEYTEIMLQYARITAPFDGIITKRFVDPGAYIPVPNAAATPEAAAIVNVTDFKTLRMQVAVPENEVRHIQLGQPVRWTTDALPGEIFDGTVTRAYWALDQVTKTMLTEVQLTNRNMMLRPGMLVNARIGLEKKEDALLLPVSTLMKEGFNSFVVLVHDGRARKVAIKTGFNDGTNFEIVSGVIPEDLAILAAKSLRDSQPVKVTEK
jgi:membrane fusion protein, multidrug efflux system